VKSALHAVRAVLPQLVESSGTVVLTLSGSAFHPEGGGVLYGSTKWALRGTLTHLARELAPHVRVNAVAPGGVSGTSIGGLRSLRQTSGRIEDPERDERLRRRSPLGTLINAEETVPSYLFLLGAGARTMTGRTLHPDGGLSVPPP
jgi:2,3-dihydroxy-2,3-dihydrophenylpropionate dehydrogenase